MSNESIEEAQARRVEEASAMIVKYGSFVQQKATNLGIGWKDRIRADVVADIKAKEAEEFTDPLPANIVTLDEIDARHDVEPIEALREELDSQNRRHDAATLAATILAGNGPLNQRHHPTPAEIIELAEWLVSGGRLDGVQG